MRDPRKFNIVAYTDELTTEPVYVSVHRDDSGTPVAESYTELVSAALDDAARLARREGVVVDRDLTDFATIVARIAVLRMATSDGFTARYGGFEHPHHIVTADLRPPDPVVHQARVMHHEPATPGTGE